MRNTRLDIINDFRKAVSESNREEATYNCHRAINGQCTEDLLRYTTVMISHQNNRYDYRQIKIAYEATLRSKIAGRITHNAMMTAASRHNDYPQAKIAYQNAIDCGADVHTYASMIDIAARNNDFSMVGAAYQSALNESLANDVTHNTMIKVAKKARLFHAVDAVCDAAKQLNPGEKYAKCYAVTFFPLHVFPPAAQASTRFTHDPYQSILNAAPVRQ